RPGQRRPPPVSTTAADPAATAGAHVGGPGTDTCRPSVALCAAHPSRSVFEVAFHYPAAASRRSLFTTLRRNVGPLRQGLAVGIRLIAWGDRRRTGRSSSARSAPRRPRLPPGSRDW